jgi:hypothetical protein
MTRKPMELWRTEAPIFAIQLAKRRWWGCQPYIPVGHLLRPVRFLIFVYVGGSVDPCHNAAGMTGLIKKSNAIIGQWTPGLPACSIVPHLTAFPCEWVDCLENAGASTFHNPTCLHGLMQDSFSLQEIRLHGAVFVRLSCPWTRHAN